MFAWSRTFYCKKGNIKLCIDDKRIRDKLVELKGFEKVLASSIRRKDEYIKMPWYEANKMLKEGKVLKEEYKKIALIQLEEVGKRLYGLGYEAGAEVEREKARSKGVWEKVKMLPYGDTLAFSEKFPGWRIDAWSVCCDSPIEHAAFIKFCPWCGARLEIDYEKEKNDEH